MKQKSKITQQSVELGQLMATTIASVVQAQEQLDAYTEQRRQSYEQSPEGSLALPPLWYVFDHVALELELSAQVAHFDNEVSGQSGPHLLSQPLNQTSVSLYGHQASSGLRVKVQMAPQGFVPVKQTARTTPRQPITDTE